MSKKSNRDIKDLEVEVTLKEAGYDYGLKLEKGQIIVINPSDIISREIGSGLIAFFLPGYLFCSLFIFSEFFYYT